MSDGINFRREKPFALILAIKNSTDPYATMLGKQIGCTHSHTAKLLDIFEKEKLTKREKEGQKFIIRLTQKGEDVACMMQSISLWKPNKGKSMPTLLKV